MSSHNLPQALIFDFDGVLVNSVEIKTNAFAELYRAYGEVVVSKVMEHHLANGGISRFEKLRHYHREFLSQTLTDRKFKELEAEFSSLVVEQVVSAPEIQGASDMIEYFFSVVPMGINSGTPQSELEKILNRRKWSNYFQIVCGSPATKVKNLHDLLEHLKVEPARSLFLGDAPADYESAQITGIKFLAISPTGESELLRRYPYLDWCRNLVDAKQWIEEREW